MKGIAVWLGVLVAWFSAGTCTELRIIAEPELKDFRDLNLMRVLRKCRRRTIMLNSLQYSCYTAIKENSVKLPAAAPSHNFAIDEQAFAGDLRILADDVGVTFRTKEFIYVYKHDTIVSQVDDAITKLLNGKPKFQNFTLGTTDPTASTAAPEHAGNRRVAPPQDAPPPSANTLFPQQNGLPYDLAHSLAEHGANIYFFDFENSIIRTAVPLLPHPVNQSVTYKITCVNRAFSLTDNQTSERIFTSDGLALSNFEIFFQENNLRNCKQITKVSRTQSSPISFADRITVHQNKLFGPVEKFCEIESGLAANKGTRLLIQITSYLPEGVKTLSFEVVEILEVLGENLYRISGHYNFEQEIRKCGRLMDRSVRYTGYIPMDDPSMHGPSSPLSGEYSPCEYEASQQFVYLEYLGSRLASILPSSSREMESGDELSCFAWINYEDGYQFTEVAITMGLQLSSNIFVTYVQEIDSSLASDQKTFDEIFDKFDVYEILTCLKKQARNEPPVLQFTARRQQQLATDRQQLFNLTKPVKIAANDLSNRLLISPEESLNNIYFLTVSEDGVVEIQTEMEGTVGNDCSILNKYVITNDKIYLSQVRVRNGSREKVDKTENSYYQNNTSSNMVIVHRGIWRAGDYLKFPRLTMNPGEKINQIEVKFGFVFIRLRDVSQIGRENFGVSSQLLTTHEGYGPFKRPERSISTSKRMKRGTHCGGTINKSREVLVSIRCGESWLRITNQSEVLPCSYELEVESQFLCASNHEPASPHQLQLFNGSICVPQFD